MVQMPVCGGCFQIDLSVGKTSENMESLLDNWNRFFAELQDFRRLDLQICALLWFFKLVCTTRERN